MDIDPSRDNSSPNSASSPTKPRIPYACEACRIAKVKCQPSNSDNICQRCFSSRRECIFKTGPRTRRRRSKLHPAATRKTPPPSAPSKTFTIDVPISSENSGDTEASDSLDHLRESHEGFLDHLIPQSDISQHSNGLLFPQSVSSSSVSGGDTVLSSPAPSAASRSLHEMSSRQPQFNLESATSLLKSFRNEMLPYFPVTTISADASVPSLARERPFVLLAILAITSGGKSLQGHNLYDEEFRKVLGLKFVTGGERSLELLTGLLIYIAWYPFHLRPKNRQALQYVRMAGDLVRDLEIDQAPKDIEFAKCRVEETQMVEIRTYLAAYHVCASFSTSWQKPSSLPHCEWTATCCSILESEANLSDRVLAWLARFDHIAEEIIGLANKHHGLSMQAEHVLFMIKGMEAQFEEWRMKIPAEVGSQPAVRMAIIFTDIVLTGYSILRFRYSSASAFSAAKKQSQPISPDIKPDPSRLLMCAHHLSTMYDYIDALPASSELPHFSGPQLAQFVLSIVLGMRLSFPLDKDCAAWDHAAARRILNLGTFLDRFASGSDDPPAATVKTTDLFSATKVIVGVVQRKYQRLLIGAEAQAAASLVQQQPPPLLPGLDDRTLHKCPMFDGSLTEYLAEWDDAFITTTDASVMAGTFAVAENMALDDESGFGTNAVNNAGTQPNVIFHDLWATMTMGWSHGDENGQGAFP